MGKKVGKRIITWGVVLVLLFILILIFLEPILKMTGFGILGIMSMFLEGSNVFVHIYSPLNTTYNFGIGDTYTINLNVSESSFTAGSWWYTLTDLKHNTIINNSVIFTPNTTFNAVRWSNNLTVYANNSDTGAVYSSGVVFFVNVSNSNPIIGYMVDEIFVCEKSSLPEFTTDSFFNISDVDEDALTASISLRPFYVAALKSFNLTLTNYYIYSGRLSKEDAGGVNAGSKTYYETINVVDEEESSDSRNVNITIIEINNAPDITNIGVQTIWTHGENRDFNYQVQVLDTEDGNQDSGNLNFSIYFSGRTLFNISSTGVMNFTANLSYLGVHNISVCVEDLGITNPHDNIGLCSQDGSSITSCNNFSLTVTSQNRAPNITNYYPANLTFNASGDDLLYFNITESDADGTLPDVYWYADDVLKEYDTGGSLIDDFFYTFGCGVSGTHFIKAFVTDGELNNSIQWNISVSAVACPVGVSPGVGGGGRGSVVECVPKWGCEEWPQCKNLRTGVGLVDISLEYEFLIKERCNLFDWSDSFCGYQTRECNDLNFCKSNLTKPGLIRECYYTENPTCNDNIKNCHDDGCEVLVDCGGPCKACETCSDGIKNQNEEDVDCGGSCPSCLITELPSLKRTIWFIYVSFVVFIILLILIVRSFIKSYKVEKKLEKEVSKRKGT